MEDPAPLQRPTYRHPRRLLAAGVAAGLLGNWWFVDAPLGIGFFVFALGWVAALRVLGGKESWGRAGAAKSLLLPMLACSGFVAVRDAPTLTALNVATAAALACLSVQLFSGERVISSLGLRGYLATALTGAARGVFAGPVVVKQSVDAEGLGAALRGYGPAMLRASAFVIPVLTVFGALLASADEVFSTLISTRVDALIDGDLESALSTAGVIAGISLVCSGTWAVALRRRDRTSDAPVMTAERRVHRGAFEAFAIIGSLLVLFGAFTAVQAACLFGQVVLPAHVTWADYAREGFFQLLAVAGLTVALITGLARVISLPAHLTRPFAAACSALVALTLVIVASAVKRLTLYEEAYGYTELRMYSHVFSYALGAMLLWRAITLWHLTQAFATGAMFCLVGCVLSLNAVNPDAFIAAKNLERGAKTGITDVAYLWQLSADASGVLSVWKESSPALWSEHVKRISQPSHGWASANLARIQARDTVGAGLARD